MSDQHSEIYKNKKQHLGERDLCHKNNLASSSEQLVMRHSQIGVCLLTHHNTRLHREGGKEGCNVCFRGGVHYVKHESQRKACAFTGALLELVWHLAG